MSESKCGCVFEGKDKCANAQGIDQCHCPCHGSESKREQEAGELEDMIDRLTCMAREKDMEAMSPMQSRLAETHKADARCLRKCISMIVALTR
jgi:hypothetical protein